MSLALTHRWEHALLAVVVDEAANACPSCYLGRTAIQKLVYFLNVMGVPMRYDFEIYHYGPFCSSLPADIEWLVADQVIVDQTYDSTKYSNYRPGPSFGELKQKFQPQLAKHSEVIRDVVRALGDMSPDALELIATLDFCYRWVRARGGKGPWKPAAVKKFQEIKKDKFRQEHIDHWYGALVEAKLIEL